MNASKKPGEMVDVNILEQGIVRVGYDNSGYLCEAVWVLGNTYFTGCEHRDVLPMVDMAENLCGFMIHGVEWISQGVDGHVTVNLRSELPQDGAGANPNGGAPDLTARKHYANPIERGIIKVRFDRAEHYCEVFWGDGGARFAETENEHILALVDADGVLAGFRIIHTDRLGENPVGCIGADLKIRMEAELQRH